MATIDNIHKDLLQHLTKDNSVVEKSLQLMKLKTNLERSDFARELLIEYKLFPEIINIEKSIEHSDKYREMGNDCFKKKDDAKALQYYNLSLLHAPNDSEQLILAYANRSAVFHSLGEHEYSLIDIRKVFSMKYPERLSAKLKNRKNKCEEILQNVEKEPDYEIYKKFQNHSIYKAASDLIEVKFDENNGRHIVAKVDICTGSVLALETPYTSILLKSHYLLRCAHCHKPAGNLQPCTSCCHALYCSDECQVAALREYHTMECPLMATLYKLNFTTIEMIAFKIICKAVSELGLNVFLDKCNQLDSLNDPLMLGLVEDNGSKVYDSRFYESTHSLANNVEKRNASDIFQKCVSASVMAELLKVSELGGVLLHHCMTAPTNMHSIPTNAIDKDGLALATLEYGVGVFPFHSLLNHSCAPNVVRMKSSRLVYNVVVSVAIRPIKEGMQLYDDYGINFAMQDKSERQMALQWQYKFTCRCEACVNNWPLYMNLVRANINPMLALRVQMVMNANQIAKLRSGDVKVAKLLRRECEELIDEVDGFAPCKQLADLQETYKQCLYLLSGVERHLYTEPLCEDVFR